MYPERLTGHGNPRHLPLVAAVLVAVAIGVTACNGAAAKTPTTTVATPTKSALAKPAPMAGSSTSFSYRVVSASIVFDAATKIYTVPISVHNGASESVAPWCSALVESSPGDDLGVSAVHESGAIAAGVTATVMVKVTQGFSGTARQAQALCASTLKAAQNSSSWSTGNLPASAAPPTTTTSPQATVTVMAACNAIRNLGEDVNIWQANNKEPANFLAEVHTFSRLVLTPGDNATLIAQSKAVVAAFKTGTLPPIHTALMNMTTTCLGLP
jgi:predicted small secreted protein